MRESALKLYHRSPLAMRSLAASLNGWRLRSWRYGPETEQLLDEALAREYWNADEWKRWHENQLGLVLHRAATSVPYYREQWDRRRRRGDKSSWEYLENWPILEKESLRVQAKSFVADDCDVRQMFRVHTSGTTGKPLDIWYSKRVARAWYALFEARCRRWHNVSRHDRWAILGGQLVTPVRAQRPPFWVWNFPLQQLYMSSYHLAPDFIPSYLDALRRYKIKYLVGYPSSLYQLALVAVQRKSTDLQMEVVITNAEPIFDHQRQAISDAFQCPVREAYGMAEIVSAASECQSGQLHSWPDVSEIEIADEMPGLSDSASGELISTGLLNVDMPLIRYRVGDRVSLPGNGNPCECGRTLPRLASIEGRCDDLLLTPDGRRVGRLDPIFKSNLPITDAQIIQEEIDLVRVRYVPAAGFTRESGLEIVERLQAHLGNMKVVLEEVDQIPRGPNRKFRAVVCNLSPEVVQKYSLLQ